MTSQRKISANRSNSQKSGGPRTSEGKRKASMNSRKHGFAGLNWERLAGSAEVDEFAKALCVDQQGQTSLIQAHVIAQNELHRRTIRQRKLGLIARLMTQSESHYCEDIADKLLVAIFEIGRLERYESRAWTRQMRAIRNFIEISRSAKY
jgi:hypothetical protein